MNNNGNIKVGDVVWMVDQELGAYVKVRVDRIIRKGRYKFNQGKEIGWVTTTIENDMASITYIEDCEWAKGEDLGYYPLDLLYDHIPTPKTAKDFHGKDMILWN